MISGTISQYGSEVRLLYLAGNLDERAIFLSVLRGLSGRSSLRLWRSVSTVTQGGSLTGELRADR